MCQAKGFICEFCQNEDDIIFPFELNKCRTCEGEVLGRSREGIAASSWTSLEGVESQPAWVSPCQPAALSCPSSLPAECKACYHKSCFKSTHCPRCERLQARRELLAKQSMESYVSDYEDELEQQEAAAAT